ncbi:hypothetical protein C436_19593 [Haloarcula marismortui ATCC 33800]|uniref:Uncharacterized protein n=1 Tax=Haloarcula marismortui ATCC 33800 TaxID=662476 RepID=M0JMF9_9EURY|nr:hypothetical protein C436_19593 [Haloarcula sinaiiensis ATCC 33800]
MLIRNYAQWHSSRIDSFFIRVHLRTDIGQLICSNQCQSFVELLLEPVANLFRTLGRFDQRFERVTVLLEFHLLVLRIDLTNSVEKLFAVVYLNRSIRSVERLVDATSTYEDLPISTVVSLYVVSPAGVPGFTPSTDMLVQ